jgi:hypothetical protein
MKFVVFMIALSLMLLPRAAHAATFDFTWESMAWVRVFEPPSDSAIAGPFTLSGSGTATFEQLAGGGARFTFDGHGGALLASGDGTFNGDITFPTADADGSRHGLGVFTQTADGFTVTVHRAASGPDAGAAFLGRATRTGGGGTVAASEPLTVAVTVTGLLAATVLSRRVRA